MALKAILVLGIAGALFSGYLSFGELVMPSLVAGVSCPSSSAGIFGIPTCVYGFVMYTIIIIVALAGLASKE